MKTTLFSTIQAVCFLLYCKLINSESDGIYNFNNKFLPMPQKSLSQKLIWTNVLTDDKLQKLGNGLLYNLAAIPGLSQTINASTIKYSCLNDTEKLISDILSKQLYAIQFLDADGKIPPGIFEGGKFWVGDYQECNSIQSDMNRFTNHRFKGKYFTIGLSITGGLLQDLQGLAIGLCLPDSCEKTDVRALANTALVSLGASNIHLLFVVDDERPNYDKVAITAFVLTGLIGTLALLGTLTDLYNQIFRGNGMFMDKKANSGILAEEPLTESTRLLTNGITIRDYSKPSKIVKLLNFLMCFSFVRNSKKLLNTSTARGPLTCLNGLRVISMFWVIQGHTYEFSLQSLANPVYALTLLRDCFTFEAVDNGTFSVDTFFFLSGLLVAYLTVKEYKDKGKMNWIYYFLHRYWRITPLYAYTLLIFLVLFTYMTAGPFAWMSSSPYGAVYHIASRCRSYWWSNLLYINNFYPNYGDLGECMSWTWYLANDMQFYIIISPILLLLFRYRKIAGVIMAVVLTLASEV